MRSLYRVKSFYLVCLATLMAVGSVFGQKSSGSTGGVAGVGVTYINLVTDIVQNSVVCTPPTGVTVTGTISVSGMSSSHTWTGITIRNKPGTGNCDENNYGSNGGNPKTINFAAKSGSGLHTYPFTYVIPASQVGPRRINVVANLSPTNSKSTALFPNVCSATVNINRAPTVSNVRSTSVACFGEATGAVTFSVTAGFPAGYTATLSGGPSAGEVTGTASGDVSFSNLKAGDYTLTVTNGTCPTTTNFTIATATLLVPTAEVTTPVACYGGQAVVTVSATGGTPTYTGTGTFNVLAGTHNFTVTDANGCSKEVSITVSEPTALLATAAITTPVACNGGLAVITVSASGGTPAYTGTGTFSVPAGGPYTYIVSDANGCSVTTTPVTVNEPALLAATAEKTADPTCAAPNGGSITVTPTGGTEPYSYSINGSANPGNVFSLLSAGDYTITVQDANGCTLASPILVNVPAPAGCGVPNNDNCIDGKLTLNMTSTLGEGGTWTYSPPAGSPIVSGVTTLGNVLVTTNENVLTLTSKDGPGSQLNPGGNKCFTYTVGAESQTFCLTRNCTSTARIGRLSTEEATLKLTVAASPNPTTGILQVKVSGAGSQKVMPLKLYDMNQRVGGVWSVDLTNGQGQATIDIRSKTDGVYILTAEGQNGKASQRVLKGGN